MDFFFKAVVFFVYCLSTITIATAQQRGKVFDHSTRKPLLDVQIVNLNNGKKTSSNEFGEFNIDAKVNDLLEFRRPGYDSDTLFLVNLKPLARYLKIQKSTLSTVTITDKRSLKERYWREFNQVKSFDLPVGRGLIFYPSRFFSREGRNARRFVKMVKLDEKNKEIDRRFNIDLIKKIVPLHQPQLDAFLIRYRPKVNFVRNANAATIKDYILDSYFKFKKLSPSEQVLPSLEVKD